MKKLLIFFTALFIIQVLNSQNVQYGLKGGANYASRILSYDTAIKYNYKLGYEFGALVKIQLNNKLYLQPELLYSMQGANYDIRIVSLILPQDPNGPLYPEDNFEGKLRESTIILPVMLKYYLSDSFNVEIGPQIDYLFHVKEDTGYDYGDGAIVSAEKTRNVSEFNFGFNVGVGYDFSDNYGLNFRYNYGFDQLNWDTSAGKLRMRNSIFSLNFEYRFN